MNFSRSLFSSLGFLNLFILIFASISTNAANETISSRGYCGDGIINGYEQCDGNDMNNMSCSTLGGGSGTLECQANCVYDISDCISSVDISDEINARVGGLAEICSCQASGENCTKECTRGTPGMTTCTYTCNQDTVCSCEGKMDAHIEECTFSCECTTDKDGFPDCDCGMKTCKMLSVIAVNIGTLTDYYTPIHMPTN